MRNGSAPVDSDPRWRSRFHRSMVWSVESEAGARPVAISERAELVGVVIDPLALATEQLRDSRRVEDSTRCSWRLADDASFHQDVGDHFRQRPKLELRHPTSPQHGRHHRRYDAGS